jgi:hypothetical protein
MLTVRINPGAIARCHDRASGQRDTANSIVSGVRYIQAAGGVHGHAQRVIQFGVGRQASIAQMASDAGPRHGGNDTGGCGHHPDAVVEVIRYKEVA